MKNIINASELQRNGLKDVYETIEKYGEAFIINQRQNKVLKIVDNENPHLLVNIIKSLKSIKEELKEKFGITQIAIFGSYSRGENKPESDLDILVDLEMKSFKQLFAIEDIISKATKIEKIDLIPFKKISQLAFHTAKKDLIYV